ncbi:MAG: dephospho-CoA kinase [Bacillota bacterium]
MKVIGLTGSAGTGKTSVARHLKTLGAEVIEADAIARELTEPGKPLLSKIAAAFGPDFLTPEGSLDRKKLRRLIFSDQAARNRLNEITHPEIIAAIKKRLAELRQRPVPPRVAVVEAPLLLETGLERIVDEVWVVIAEREAVIRRLVARDRIPPEQAQAIIAAQMAQEDKVRKAHRVIDNSGGFDHSREQVAYFYKKLIEEQGETEQ